jgi:hypothetical protein
MKRIKYTVLNSIIECYPQFKENSLLYSEIMKAIDCKMSEAKEYAATHCNMLSLWAILRADSNYDKGYSEFFKWMLVENNCTVKGYINKDKEIIFKSLGINEYTGKYFEEYEDVLNPIRLDIDRFYQMKIKGNTSGFHFMACYIQGDKLYITDSSSRGIGVPAVDHITEKNFVWLKEY